jgi:hypothetical protein
MTARVRAILGAGLVALVALTAAACGAVGSSLYPSGTTTTLMVGWDHWFKLQWSVEPAADGDRSIHGYITNEYGGPAEPVRLLGQALDTSDAVVGQRIVFIPEGVGGFDRAYFEISHLPLADHYRVSVWDYTFLQAESERP